MRKFDAIMRFPVKLTSVRGGTNSKMTLARTILTTTGTGFQIRPHRAFTDTIGDRNVHNKQKGKNL